MSRETDPLPTQIQSVVFQMHQPQQIGLCLLSKTLMITQRLNPSFGDPGPIDVAGLYVAGLRTVVTLYKSIPLLLDCHLRLRDMPQGRERCKAKEN